jgi:hypothetical protein
MTGMDLDALEPNGTLSQQLKRFTTVSTNLGLSVAVAHAASSVRPAVSKEQGILGDGTDQGSVVESGSSSKLVVSAVLWRGCVEIRECLTWTQ